MIKKKLMFVNAVFPPYTGGSGIICYELAKELSKYYKVFIFSGGNEEKIEKNSKLDIIRINTFNNYSPHSKSDFINPLIEKKFVDTVLKNKIDIVHFHSIQGLGANLVEKSYNLKKKVIITMHDFWWICPFLFLHNENYINVPITHHFKYCSINIPEEVLINRFNYLKRILSLPKIKITTVSQKIKEILLFSPLGKILRNKLLIIENGLPDHFWDKRRQNFIHQKFNEKKKIHFGYIGSINNSKGWNVLINSINILSSYNNLDYSLLVLSNCKDINHSRINYLDPISHDHMPDFYNKIDCVIVPSQVNESYSLVANEAILFNKFIISSGMGALSELISPLHLKYQPSYNSFELAKKIYFFITNFQKLVDYCFFKKIKMPKIKKVSQITNDYRKLYEQ